MKSLLVLLAFVTMSGLSPVSAAATVHYVDLNSTNAASPYTNWTTAATNIQDAVDAAIAGDEVAVTNGTYASGGHSLYGGIRVVVDKPLTLRSVNGPQVTIIDGGHSGRCVYLTNSATLCGFTVTNGNAPSFYSIGGGGVVCESASAVVSNCMLVGNSNTDGVGGGAYQGTLNNCILAANSSYASGGGAYNCTLNNCTLSNNAALFPYGGGGGAYNSVLTDCALIGNSAGGAGGGGAAGCTLINCTLTSNFSTNQPGGGALGCTLNNCVLMSNSAVGSVPEGGGAYGCTLNNCTLASNTALYGGGAYDCTLKNCILYYNTGENYDAVGTPDLNYCCTSPLPASGAGNISFAPRFVDLASRNLRLQSNSPCINAGNNALAVANTDLDDNPRIVCGTVDMGAYEYQSLSLLNFSVISNQVGFSITGQSNQVILLEASTNLLNWSPLATNTLSGHPFSFSDVTPTTLPRRFYRAQVQ